VGLVYAEITIISTDDTALARRGYIEESEIRKITVNAMVDSGAHMLTINEEIRIQLDLPLMEEQEMELADGSLIKVDIVGPVDIHFENRSTTVRAAVMSQEAEVLLGAIPMEDMDVIIDPKRQKLIVHPNRPYMARKVLK